MVLFSVENIARQAKRLLPDPCTGIMSSLCDKKSCLQKVNFFAKSKGKKKNAKASSYFSLPFPV